MTHSFAAFTLRLPPFCKPWILLPVLLAICLQTAWLGIHLAAAAVPEPLPAGLPVAPAADSAGLNARMTSAQCMSCHQTQPALSHPVKMQPKMSIPAAFPLENGQVNCITCHSDTFTAHAAASTTNLLLRTAASGLAFCAECHTPDSLSRQSQHPTALAQAHLSWPRAARTSSNNTPTPLADDGVNSCLACHDGTVARDAFAGLNTTSFSMGAAKGHPVGVAYPSSTLRRGDARFNLATHLDPRIRLTGGQVTCNACHSLYSPERSLLVMRNDNSVLCLNCHAQ